MEYDWTITAKLLKDLRSEYNGKGISHAALSKALEREYGEKISASSLKNYEVSTPNHTKARKVEGMSIRSLYYLADFFGVSTDYLLGRAKQPTPKEDVRAICDYTGLSDTAIHSLVALKHEPKVGIQFGHKSAILDELLQSDSFNFLLSAIQYAAAAKHQAEQHNDSIPTYEEFIDQLEADSKEPNAIGLTPEMAAELISYRAAYMAQKTAEIAIKRMLLRLWDEGSQEDREEIQRDTNHLAGAAEAFKKISEKITKK